MHFPDEPGRHEAEASCSRRHFLGTMAATGVTLGVVSLESVVFGAASSFKMEIGVCSSSAKWDAIRKAGCTYVEENVGKFLNPTMSDADFEAFANGFKQRGIPVRACNGFLPAELKLVGPVARHDDAVTYAAKALQRAGMLGIGIVVLGSGRARAVPDGFEKARADEQFIQVVKRIGKAAEQAGVTVAMESLNRSETNYGNTVRECLRLINAIDHPRVRLTADIYHMLMENEGPDAIFEAGPKIVHCHIAEKAGRAAPGTAGEDFKPYFRALQKVKYNGRLSMECRWKSFDTDLSLGVRFLKSQIEAIQSNA